MQNQLPPLVPGMPPPPMPGIPPVREDQNSYPPGSSQNGESHAKSNAHGRPEVRGDILEEKPKVVPADEEVQIREQAWWQVWESLDLQRVHRAEHIASRSRKRLWTVGPRELADEQNDCSV